MSKPEKILISFLGTTNYLECNYTFNENEKFLTKYTQAAIANKYSDQLARILIFLTKDAYRENWQNNDALKTNLEKIIEHDKIFTYNIPDGIGEDELKEIFEIIVDKISDESILIIDATHSFRSLPLTLSAIIFYLKITKRISIEAIYYGAFEKLGNSKDIQKLQPSERLVPMLNLNFLNSIQDWTMAINNFIKFGNIDLLNKLVNDSIHPTLKETKGQHEFSQTLKSVNKQLKNLLAYIYTCRIKELLKFDYNKIKSDVEKLISDKDLIIQLKQPFEKLNEQLQDLSNDPYLNVILLVNWCIKYNWIQQGFTLLQEGIISYILNKINLDHLNKNLRKEVSKQLNGYKIRSTLLYKLYFFCFFRIKEDEIKIIKSMINEYSQDFKSLTQLRNDINHGGIRKNDTSYENLEDNLNTIYNNILSKIKEKKPVLINFTNHLFSKWSEKQIYTSFKLFSEIYDLEFPKVDPQGDENYIEELSNSYLEIILKLKEKYNHIVVHVMGEMTFCFSLISKLANYNIKCVSSTTSRNVIEKDNNKISNFEFERFRYYKI